ncbi:MAG: tRNA epoxyqueuosine(34) reductase QueG [Magnetococcales bacterium]|nr:tRNA epoxyqueuosine(34) reductase QueG [Magnetococcales bacterium]
MDPQGEAIAAAARAEGFVLAGIARAEPPPGAEHLPGWLAEGRHGGMAWLARDPARRADPRGWRPEARSVIALAALAPPPQSPGPPSDPGRGVIAAHAARPDYHTVLRQRAEAVLERLRRAWGVELPAWVAVDSAPLLEKPLGVAAGLGWQGKNALLISRRHGPWLLLTEILLPLDLPPSAPQGDHCGSCTRCLDACPTRCLTPYRLDASRCLAYLTIEYKGVIPQEFWCPLGNRIYGCDDCLTACPFGRFAPSASPWPEFQPLPPLVAPSLVELAALDEAAFRARFAGTPVLRIKRGRLLRNVAIALGNALAQRDDADQRRALQRLAADPDPLVAEQAARVLVERVGDPPRA